MHILSRGCIWNVASLLPSVRTTGNLEQPNFYIQTSQKKEEGPKLVKKGINCRKQFTADTTTNTAFLKRLTE
jgi:hypothetical protein